MALAHVQDTSLVAATAQPTYLTVVLTPTITAGNVVVVAIFQTVSGTRTYTVSDDIDGAYTKATAACVIGTPGGVNLFYITNHTGGSATITITHSNATVGFSAMAMEFNGYTATPVLDAADALNESPTSYTTHTASTSGVSTPNECIAVVAGITSASIGTGKYCLAGTGYTIAPSALQDTRILAQWRRFASGCSAEVGTWTQDTGSTARYAMSGIILLSGGAAGGGTTIPVFMSTYRRRFSS